MPAGAIVTAATGAALAAASLALLRWLLSPTDPASSPSAVDRAERDLRVDSFHRDLRSLVHAASLGVAAAVGATVWSLAAG